MINRIVFKNYRCFEDSELSFREMSIVVGSNNAGKSTIIESLRIVSAIAQKFKHSSYTTAPRELELPFTTRGINVNADLLKIDLKTVVNQYKEDTYAHINAYFDNNICIRVYLSTDFIYAVIESDKKIITTKSDAVRLDDIRLYIMPQIGLIREDEPMLAKETVQRDMSTRLSSRHFRNELFLYKNEHFDNFKELAQDTWPKLRIDDISYNQNVNRMELVVYDSDYAAEIGLMGSGLQMWLQIIWFISRCPTSSTIVLDEPDVYMHPELQRKILNIVKDNFRQVIIATHSIEIISGVNPYNIVTVDKKQKKMQYAGNYKAVQYIVNNLGSDYNLALIRLGSVKKCLFVEGKDIKTLTKIQSIINLKNPIMIDQLPSVELGGWSRFTEALGTSRLFFDETKGDIKTFCILDRDYHTEQEIDDLYKKAKENYLELHVWKKKELENYLLTPKSIFKITNLPEGKYEEFYETLFEKIDDLKDQTRGGILDQLVKSDKSKTPSYFLKDADEILNKKWDTLENRLSLANGKDLISLINDFIKTKYNRSCSRAKLLEALSPTDIDCEMKDVVEMLTSPIIETNWI